MASNNNHPVPQLRGNWNYPTTIWFGSGRIAELPAACKMLGIKHPLLVTDPGLAALPMIHDAVAANQKAEIPTGVFSNIKPNPVGQNVEDGVRAFQLGEYDGVIAFGGGSALDAGKAIAFMAGQDRPIWDFVDEGENYKRAKLPRIAPIVAVPTTAGTGSEVGRASVITRESTHEKKIIFHPKMLPGIALCDPQLTVGLPAKTTAATGMDALAHNLEAFSGTSFHPLADGIAVEGTKLIRDWLPVAVHDGSNIEARSKMMAAATMGAAAFQKALGAIHSLSHPLGALYDLHHGLLNGVVMPYVLLFNRSAIDTRMACLAAYLGLEPTFQGLLDWVLDLRREIGIPETLGQLGVDQTNLDQLVPMAMADPSTAGNPVPLDKRSMEKLFRNAIDGVLE